MQQTPSALHPPVTPPREAPRKSQPRTSLRWLWLVGLAAIAVLAYFYQTKWKGASATPPPATAKSGKKGKGGGNSNVVGARAKKGNIGIYITGLGSVTPIYTVTVKSRVDGQLMNVAFKEGQLVQKDDLLVEIDPRPYQLALNQAEGQMLRDQALLKNARVDLDRYKALVATDAIPQQQLATQDALVAQYEGTVKTDQANVDIAKLNVTYSRITSPITGLVGLRLVDPGNIVHATDSNGMLMITQLDPISVIFTTAEDQLPAVLDKLHAGQKLTVEAWDRDLKNKLGTGSLSTTDNQIDSTTGTLRLRATFENKNRKLFPNQFVNARMLVEEKRDVTLVPTAVIQRNAQSTYVWLVKPDKTVTVRPVTLGATEGEQSEVVTGVDLGDVMVMVGVDKLQEGGRISVEVAGESKSKSGKSGKSGKHKKSEE